MTDRDLYLACLPKWADMYVAGQWTLEQFEAHADRMRIALFPGWAAGIAKLNERPHAR